MHVKMPSIRVFLLLFVLGHPLVKSEMKKKVSIDEALGSRYKFDLFENFDGTKEVYLKEDVVIKKLLNIKTKLLECQNKLKNFIGAFKRDREDILPDLRRVLNNGFKNQLENSVALKEMTKEYPTKNDYNGAIKGMVVLHFSYYYNVTKAVEEGKISYVKRINWFREYKEFESYEKLSILDVEQFAIATLDDGNYALSIEFVRSILKLLPQIKKSDYKIHKNLKGMSKRINKMKENLIRLNNGYLEKHQTFIKNNFRTLTYMVDKQLMRKKKQPKFIEDYSVYRAQFDDNSNRRGSEWFAMNVCQNGKWMTPQLNLRYYCQYLHHGNPYLKLGPFKEG